MMNRKTLFTGILILGILLSLTACGAGSPDETLHIVDPTAPTTQPTETEEPTETTEATKATEETKPEATDPTEETKPQEKPEKKADSTGQIVSNQCDYLSIVGDWAFTDNGDGTGTVKVSASLKCWTLNSVAKKDLGKIKVGDEVFTFSTPEINQTESKAVTIPLAEHSFKVDSSKKSIPLTVSWALQGTYSGVEIDVLEANGTILP